MREKKGCGQVFFLTWDVKPRTWSPPVHGPTLKRRRGAPGRGTVGHRPRGAEARAKGSRGGGAIRPVAANRATLRPGERHHHGELGAHRMMQGAKVCSCCGARLQRCICP